jgi:AcrR family transcriptional regulator
MKTLPARSEVRLRILDAALDLLAEHGVSHLTQPRVSKLLARPLLEQALQGQLRRAELAAVLAQGLTDRRRMRVMLGVIAAADEDPKVREALRELIAAIRGQLTALLRALGLAGETAQVALLHTFVVGAAVLHHARADEPARREAQEAVQFVCSLLPRLQELAPAGRAAPLSPSERRL